MRRCSGSAMVDIRLWCDIRVVPRSGIQRRVWVTPRVDGRRVERYVTLRRQDLDQLAPAGVDLRMLQLPFDRDFLERHVLLQVAVDHLAHARAREEVQVGLPGFVGEPLAFLGHLEHGVELGGVGMLRVLGDREVVVALLRGIERHHLADRRALLLPLQRILAGAVHHQREILAGGDALGLAAADQAGDLRATAW